MRQRGTRYKQCERKVRYENVDQAIDASVNVLFRSSTVVEPYRCRFCGGWHVGRQNDRSRKN